MEEADPSQAPLITAAKNVPSPLVEDHELLPDQLTSEGKVQPAVYARVLLYVRAVLAALGVSALIKCGVCYADRKDIRPNDGGKHAYHAAFYGKGMYFFPFGDRQFYTKHALKALECVFADGLQQLCRGLNIAGGGGGGCQPYGACQLAAPRRVPHWLRPLPPPQPRAAPPPHAQGAHSHAVVRLAEPTVRPAAEDRAPRPFLTVHGPQCPGPSVF